MKTLRFRIGKDVKPGILDSEENIRDASSLVNDLALFNNSSDMVFISAGLKPLQLQIASKSFVI